MDATALSGKGIDYAVRPSVRGHHEVHVTRE